MSQPIVNIFTSLLSSASEDIRHDAIEQLINIHELSLDYQVLHNIFLKLGNHYCRADLQLVNNMMIKLLEHLLCENKGLLQSLLYTINDNWNMAFRLLNVLIQVYWIKIDEKYPDAKISKEFPYYQMEYSNDGSFRYFYRTKICPQEELCVFCWLQNYHKFDVTNLPIPEDHKEMIHSYTNRKNIKAVVKRN